MAKVSPLMLAPPLVFAAFAALFLLGTQRDDPDAMPSAIEGKPVPSIAALGELPGFQRFEADALSKGGIKLVNYWASWCGPCRVEHPNLTMLAEEGIPIYGINYKDNTANATAFLEELGDPYEGIGVDDRGRVALEWGVFGVPETYVIGPNGTVLLRFAGPVTQRALEERIRPVMESASGGS